jgi:hypothetical protein
MSVGVLLTIAALISALTSSYQLGLPAQFLHRWRVMGVGGIVLGLTAGILGRGKRAQHGMDWLRPADVGLLLCLALVATAVDINLSRKIGLLAYPPYYDGVQYMVDAKSAFLHLGWWRTHPISFAHTTFGNRYPVWQGLMVVNFVFFGQGEWQSYAARFWPTLIICAVVFWVVRRRMGAVGAWTAALVTALLPTISVNLQAALAGHHTMTHGYLADLRPDLLFAAFLLASVAVLVERASAFDESAALLSGACAALAVLTKSSAMGALVVAWCVAGLYALLVNRRNLLHTLQMTLWALLMFSVLLLPWALAGGIGIATDYIRSVLTVELPFYSNPHATFKTESTYYWKLFGLHVGTVGLVLLFSGTIVFFFLLVQKKQDVHHKGRLLAYLTIGISLYVLVSLSPAKNYFLGLPCYFILWVFSLASLALALASLRLWQPGFSWMFLSACLLYAGLTGIQGYQNLRRWSKQELQEGPYNQNVMRQMASDLNEILSHRDRFMWTPEYGSPSTFLYYMPRAQDELPEVVGVDAMVDPLPDQYAREFIEPAKAVLVLRGDIEKFNDLGMGAVNPANYPYYRAAAEWVRRPGSSHHLLKTYHFFGGENNPELTVDLYVKDFNRRAQPSPDVNGQKAQAPRGGFTRVTISR